MGQRAAIRCLFAGHLDTASAPPPSHWLQCLRAMKVRDAIKRLEQDGWRLVRTKGSHRQYHHPTKPGTVTVAGHPSVDIPLGTLNNILKQAGLK